MNFSDAKLMFGPIGRLPHRLITHKPGTIGKFQYDSKLSKTALPGANPDPCIPREVNHVCSVTKRYRPITTTLTRPYIIGIIGDVRMKALFDAFTRRTMQRQLEFRMNNMCLRDGQLRFNFLPVLPEEYS